MRVLLLHPEDSFSTLKSAAHSWDLIVDLARAPLSTYEEWKRQAGCRIVSLYDFADENGDQLHVKALLQLGRDQLVDSSGVDWWDVYSLLIVDELLRVMLAARVAEEIGPGCDFYVSHRSPTVQVLCHRSRGALHVVETTAQPLNRAIRHYGEVFANLNPAQIMQVLHDKFDPEHQMRRRFGKRREGREGPVILLPSNYVNVSRMAVAYAAMLPAERFLLVYSRNVGKLKTLPANVAMMSLDPYFVPANKKETTLLWRRWEEIKTRLVSAAVEFADLEANGTLARIPVHLRTGLAVREAWIQVFEQESITACLSTDDTAPDSRIPLILAKNRGLPAIACHHGALDSRMAIKTLYADTYLVKGEMERDYLQRVCLVPPEKLVVGGPESLKPAAITAPNSSSGDWLVIFTEPYQAYAWRIDEVYRDFLPRLSALAKSCGLSLVFKLHPFESVKSIRRLLRRYLPAEERAIQVIDGPITPQLWQNTKLALTVQSTVALECSTRGIPIFLCGWLREPFGGYIRQFARFGIGCVLESAEQIADIPRLLKAKNAERAPNGAHWQAIDRLTLQKLLRGA